MEDKTQERFMATAYRLTLEQYAALITSGVFSEHDRFHLINGLLVEKMPSFDPHATADELCGRALDKTIPPGWHVRSAQPVRIPPNSKTEPDRSVVRGTIRDYSNRSPGPEDVGLLVEIADTSLAADRMMARTFSAGGIAVYWIVNSPESQIEVYTDPTADGYATMRVYKAGEDVPIVLDGAEVGRIAVAAVLP
jgi:Uma2 family endonuclease